MQRVIDGMAQYTVYRFQTWTAGFSSVIQQNVCKKLYRVHNIEKCWFMLPECLTASRRTAAEDTAKATTHTAEDGHKYGHANQNDDGESSYYKQREKWKVRNTKKTKTVKKKKKPNVIQLQQTNWLVYTRAIV